MLDVDYHHGNGTQAIFYERADVLTVSIHGDPRTGYPFFLGHADERGAGTGPGFNLNLPLPRGTDYAQVGRDIADASLPTVFVFEGGYAVAEVGINTVNVLEAFDAA